MKLSAVLALLLAVSFGVPALAGDKYKMKDLEALAKSESWLELLAHAMDVAPSDRDDDWQELVVKAASGRFDELKDEDLKYLSGIKSTIEGDEKVFPFLKKSKTYRRAANKATVKTLKGCYMSGECKQGNDPDWLNMVREWVEEHK